MSAASEIIDLLLDLTPGKVPTPAVAQIITRVAYMGQAEQQIRVEVQQLRAEIRELEDECRCDWDCSACHAHCEEDGACGEGCPWENDDEDAERQ